MKNFLIALVTVTLIAPQVALASWWNPFSWFKKTTPQPVQQTQIVNLNTKKATTAATTSTVKINTKVNQSKTQTQTVKIEDKGVIVNSILPKTIDTQKIAIVPTASTPPEMIGVWIFNEMLGFTVDNKIIPVSPDRIPQGLQVLKITKDGFCHNPRHEISGDEMGILCAKYLAPAFVGPNMKLHKDYIWIELFSGFKEGGSVASRKRWPEPNAYKIAGNTLELIVKSDDGSKDLWIYKFHKHPVVYTNKALTLYADREVVNPGEDIVLSGTAPVGSVVRFNSNTPSYATVNCTAKGYCSSPPIVLKGKRVPYPPGTDKNVLSQDEQYFDCPWPETQISTPVGVFASAPLCVTPDETGAFEVKLFNNGVNTEDSRQDHYEGTYYAKLANEPVVRSVKAILLSCKRFPNMSCGYSNVLQRK